MSGQTIFAHRSHVHDCWINVMGAPETDYHYFAHMAQDRQTCHGAGLVSHLHGNGRMLYRIRVIAKKDFPIIGRKRGTERSPKLPGTALYDHRKTFVHKPPK